MPSIDQYQDDNDKLRLILQGDPGTGKTTVACQFPKAWVIDIDVNLGGTLRYIKEQNLLGKKLSLPLGYDVLDRDDKGEKVEMRNRYQRLALILERLASNPEVETIIIDSGTTLADVMIAEVLRQQSKSEMSKREWGFFAILGRHFMNVLSSMRKHIVLIVHEKMEKTESGAIVYPIKVAWPGQVGQNIGAFFTNVWRCEVQVLPSGPNQNTYKWLLRTMPEAKYALKNTLGVPATFEFKWETIQAKLTPVKKP